MERDIILPVDIVMPYICAIRIPKALKAVSGLSTPLPASGKIAQNCLQPDVYLLMLKAGEGDINTPVNIPCGGPIGKSFIQVSSGQTNGVSPPMLCPSEKISDVLFQSAKGMKRWVEALKSGSALQIPHFLSSSCAGSKRLPQ